MFLTPVKKVLGIEVLQRRMHASRKEVLRLCAVLLYCCAFCLFLSLVLSARRLLEESGPLANPPRSGRGGMPMVMPKERKESEWRVDVIGTQSTSRSKSGPSTAGSQGSDEPSEVVWLNDIEV